MNTKHIAAAASLFGISIFMLSGCTMTSKQINLSINGYHYENADKYTPGGAKISNPVSKIDIDWISGDVIIETHDDDSIEFSETSQVKLDEKQQMQYFYENETLHIRFSGVNTNIPDNAHKKVTLYLPGDLELSDFTLDTVSADSNIQNLMTKQMELSTVSGNVTLDDCTVSDTIGYDGVSGDLTLNAQSVIGRMQTSTVSGKINIGAAYVKELTSDSTSGKITFSCATEPDVFSADSVSGDIDLSIPKDASFSLQYDSISGDLTSEIPSRKENKKYVFGDGNKSYKINTVSGDVTIKEVNE